MANLTRADRVINHIKASVELYYSSLIEVINFKERDCYSSKVILGSRRGKRYPLRYTFNSIEQRQLFLDDFKKLYPDVPIVEENVN